MRADYHLFNVFGTTTSRMQIFYFQEGNNMLKNYLLHTIIFFASVEIRKSKIITPFSNNHCKFHFYVRNSKYIF